jgi:hypothetical protein
LRVSSLYKRHIHRHPQMYFFAHHGCPLEHIPNITSKLCILQPSGRIQHGLFRESPISLLNDDSNGLWIQRSYNIQ